MIAVRAIVPVLLRPRIAADAEDPRFRSANSGNELLREKIDFFRRTGQFEILLADLVKDLPHEGERIEMGGERVHPHRLHDVERGSAGEELSGAFHGVALKVSFINPNSHFYAPFTLGFCWPTRASVAADSLGPPPGRFWSTHKIERWPLTVPVWAYFYYVSSCRWV